MGMNNEGARRFVIDLETAPIADAADYLDLSGFSAPSNWKDPEKIAANVKEQQQAAIAKAALDLDLCRIVALGWMAEDETEPTVCVAQDAVLEISVLQTFWQALDARTTVGYNQVGFDLPILLRRSLYLGVPAPMLNLDKYRSNHVDLQQKLSLNGTKPYRSLNWYAKRFGLDVPKDDTSGKDIGALVAASDWDGVAAHCRADVLKTHALAVRMGILHSQPEPVLLEAGF